ncbi:MAG: class I SAM-dependent methyltransferase [Planctomycetota bacterium]
MQADDVLPYHRLDLYRLAVQHPLAEVAFVEHAWSHFHGKASEPMLLREDFAGTCAVAAAWVASDPDRQAMAIELDEATVDWASTRFSEPDLHIVHGDVLSLTEPIVDVTLTLNFSVLIYHNQDDLLRYLVHARSCLKPGGLLVLDLFGGPEIDQPSTTQRHVEPDEGGFVPFNYLWQQDGLDTQSGRIRCRIHFEWEDGHRLSDAFVYDWRLWEPATLIGLAEEAGFEEAAFWWSDPSEPGRFMPVQEVPGDQQWVGYVVCKAAL